MIDNIVRTHDKFYLKENRYKKTKQIFKDVIDWKDEDLVISAIMRKEKYESFSDHQ